MRFIYFLFFIIFSQSVYACEGGEQASFYILLASIFMFAFIIWGMKKFLNKTKKLQSQRIIGLILIGLSVSVGAYLIIYQGLGETFLDKTLGNILMKCDNEFNF